MATAGVMSFKGPMRGTLLFQEAHGVGGGIGMSRQIGRPDHRPAVRPAESAGRTPPPFHSDELQAPAPPGPSIRHTPSKAAPSVGGRGGSQRREGTACARRA